MKIRFKNKAPCFQNRKKIKKAFPSGYCKKRKNRKKAYPKGYVTLNGVIQNYSE